MKKSILYLLGTLLTSLILSGCAGSKNIAVKTPASSLMNDKDKAYVVFTTFDRAFMNMEAKIMEFELKTLKPTYLGSFDNNQKYIHKIDVGKHFYFIDKKGIAWFAPNHIITIDAKAGEVYYVNSLVGSVMSNSRKEITDKIKKSSCSSEYLKRYGFFTEAGSEFKSDLLSYKIKCENTKVVEVHDERLLSFDDIDKAILVETPEDSLKKFYEQTKPNKESSEYIQEKVASSEVEKNQEKIRETLPFVTGPHKNVFQYYSPTLRFTEMYSLDVIQSTSDSNANKHQGIKLSNLNDIGNAEQKYSNDFNAKIIQNIEKQKLISLNDIEIKYRIDNYEDGSQAARYFGLTESQRFSGMSSLRLNAKFIDINSGETIGEIQYVSIMQGGMLGGTIGLLSDAADHIVEYAKMNYIK